MKRACRTISQWTNSVPKRHASRSFTCGSAHRRSAQQTNSNSRSPIHHQQASVASSTLLRRARTFHTSSTAWHGHLTPPKAGEERKITFIDKEGQSHEFLVGDGDNLLDIAQAHDLEMEGACGGSCACSTCHVIVEDGDMYDKIVSTSAFVEIIENCFPIKIPLLCRH
jgi:hypothetical protein